MSKDIKIIKKSVFKDLRGRLWTSWKKTDHKNLKFNKDKFSISKKNTLRGFHCDFKSWKLITSVYGKFLLVAVNLKKNSKNYLKNKSFVIDHLSPKTVLLPPHYANAHLCLSKFCIFHYKWSYTGKYIDAKKQVSIRWNDPKINVKWPIKKPILSSRDSSSKFL